MKRALVVWPTVIACGLIGYFAIYKTQQNAYGMDQFSEETSWQPDAATIQRAIGAPNPAGAEDIKDARHVQFAQLFQKRYRDHQPEAIAVGLHFLNKDTIKLLCPARFEPWNTDRLAMSAWQEARRAFGKSFDVDIYATYIGTPPIKIGVLLPVEGHPDASHITYLYGDKPHYR
jgi:hypothetical protein